MKAKAQLVKQLTRSGVEGFSYLKRTQVSADADTKPTWEERRFAVQAGRIFLQGRDTSTVPFAGEFAYATDLGYDDTGVADLFTTSMHGDTLVAMLDSGIHRKCDLLREAVVRDAQGVIRYAAVRTRRSSTLYQTDTQTEMWFDAQGRYIRHTLSLQLRVRLLGQPRRVHVMGQRL